MQVELVGCTGTGKSTLLQAMLQACRAEGVEASSGEDYLLSRAGLDWVRAPLARSLLLDLVALPFALLAWKRHAGFLRFSSVLILGLPRTVPWWERLNIGRNVIKKIGLYEGLRRMLPVDHLAIVDEGTVHTAHYLFIHSSVEPPEGALAAFASLVPVPDALVLLREQEEVLVSRTLQRGHKRIRAASPGSVRLFIRRAVEMFDTLSGIPALRDRMFVAGQNGSLSTPGPLFMVSDRLRLPTLLQEAIGIAGREQSHETVPSLHNENVVIPHDAGTD